MFSSTLHPIGHLRLIIATLVTDAIALTRQNAFLLTPLLRISARRALAGIALVCVGLATVTPAAAQAIYRYTGNAFTSFSCGPSSSGNGTASCSTPAPTNAFTSYLATDFVSATLTLSGALPANMALTDVRNFAGFQLTMSDVRHTVTNAPLLGMAAEVATDGSGNIVNWRLIINTGGIDNGGIATQKATFVSDMGTLRCCDPTVSGDFARVSNLPGSWTGGTPSPAAATTNLIALVASPELALTVGQVASYSDKLNNVLASIAAGEKKQAINQLGSFINAVESARKNFKISAQAATLLTDAASAIIAVLS